MRHRGVFEVQFDQIIFKKVQLACHHKLTFFCCFRRALSHWMCSLGDKAEGLASLQGEGVGDFLGKVAIGGLGVEEGREVLLVELVAVWSLGVNHLHELSALILVELSVTICVMGGEEMLEHFFKLSGSN